MLTPTFRLTQDDNIVTVIIKCPYIKSQDIEFFIEGPEFKFYAKPYFLRLQLPGSIVEDGREKAVYDVGVGEITLQLPKATPGEVFADLDLLTKLMAPRNTTLPQENGTSTPRPLIEVLESRSVGLESDGPSVRLSANEVEEMDWDYPQTIPDEPELQTKAKYGFNNQYSGYGDHIGQLMQEISDISNLETSTPASRRDERLERENAKFDDEYYIADFLNQDVIEPILKFKPKSWKLLKKVQTSRESGSEGTPASVEVSLSEEDLEMMRVLPNKQYLLDDEKSTYLGLVDIIFAYCYNHRTTEGENTVESPWTVAKLSSTLACFESFHGLREVIVACIRRSLAYPLYRNFALALRCLEDVAVMFKLGKRSLLSGLLEVKRLIGGDDRMYVLSRLWLDDYCVWIQQASDHMLASLGSELNHIRIEKQEIGWNLEELESQAAALREEDSET
ncbi:SHQ1 protein-domain-containing protein [Phlyctochytrium arcticum]|nr:SHQ1 protein-domain-containing protein [Phlyctochytrium arcticum]